MLNNVSFFEWCLFPYGLMWGSPNFVRRNTDCSPAATKICTWIKQSGSSRGWCRFICVFSSERINFFKLLTLKLVHVFINAAWKFVLIYKILLCVPWTTVQNNECMHRIYSFYSICTIYKKNEILAGETGFGMNFDKLNEKFDDS